MPGVAREIASAIRAQPIVDFYLKPVSTLAKAVQLVGPTRRYRRRDVKIDASDDMAILRFLAMATSALFIAIAVGPIWLSSNLSQPFDVLSCIVGTVFGFVPAGTVAITLLVARFASPHKLLERVAIGDLGRQMDAGVWCISAVVGSAFGWWLSTSVK